MHKSFFPLFFLSLAGVISTAIFARNNWMWGGLCAGLAPIVIYHIILRREKNVSATEVDSIYYFGFLVTVVTLVVTALSIGLEKGHLDINSVLVKFALGLIATGYALFARLHLLTKFSSQAENDVVEATENLAKSVEKVAQKFDQAGHHVTAFIEQTEQRMQQAANSYQNQLNEAAVAFNKTLADSAAVSLSNTYHTIDTAVHKFSMTISSIMDQSVRIQAEAESISFARAALCIEDFSNEMVASLEFVTAQAIAASESGADAIIELNNVMKKTLKTTESFTFHLEAMAKIETLLSIIKSTTSALEDMSKTAACTSDSISSLGQNIDQSEQAVRQNVTEPLSASGLSEVMGRLTDEFQVVEAQAVSLARMIAQRQKSLSFSLMSASSGLRTVNATDFNAFGCAWSAPQSEACAESAAPGHSGKIHLRLAPTQSRWS
jgi:hypothetical protein